MASLILCAAANAAPNSIWESFADKPDILDKVSVKYWGNYDGPPLNNPSATTTTSVTGQPKQVAQNADDLLTVGFKIAPGIQPGIGVPFNFVPFQKAVIQIKPLYFGLIDLKLFEVGNLSMHTDVRIYTPLGDVASSQDVQTGFRASQITLYQIPGSKWTIGSYSYFRYWKYGPNGTGFRNDYEVYFSFLAWYPLSREFDVTVWSDLLQLGHQFGKPGGLQNLPIDFQPGIRWNVGRAFNINPYFNFIPGNLRWDTFNIGLVVNAALL